MKHPNWFDWMIYRLFMWRWNPIFKANSQIRDRFYRLFGQWPYNYSVDEWVKEGGEVQNLSKQQPSSK